MALLPSPGVFRDTGNCGVGPRYLLAVCREQVYNNHYTILKCLLRSGTIYISITVIHRFPNTTVPLGRGTFIPGPVDSLGSRPWSCFLWEEIEPSMDPHTHPHSRDLENVTH